MDILTTILLALLGSVIVIIGATLGIGAGFIVVPVLVLFFDIPLHNAITTSFITIIAISVSVSRINVRRGLVNIKLATILELACIVGAGIGAMVAVETNPAKLKIIFSSVLIMASLIMLKKSLPKKYSLGAPENEKTQGLDGKLYDYENKKITTYTVKNIPVATMGAFLGGGLSGLTGIGGGIVNVPLLNLICKAPIKAASATSNYMLSVTAATGAMIYIKKGYFEPQTVLPIVTGVIIASGVGAKILRNIKARYIEIIFSLILFITAIRMVME